MVTLYTYITLHNCKHCDPIQEHWVYNSHWKLLQLLGSTSTAVNTTAGVLVKVSAYKSSAADDKGVKENFFNDAVNSQNTTVSLVNEVLG
jgi:hypothetical protein